MKSKKKQKTTKRSKNGKKMTDAAAIVKTAESLAESKRTIKQVVMETIAANSAATNEEMIAAVKAEFPKSAFKDTHAAWYRSQARKGLLTGSPIPIPAMSRKQSPAVN
jgi:aromatic ring hydroxylase